MTESLEESLALRTSWHFQVLRRSFFTEIQVIFLVGWLFFMKLGAAVRSRWLGKWSDMSERFWYVCWLMQVVKEETVV
jgi:hypothetical protein